MKLQGYGESRLIAELVSGIGHFHQEVLTGPGDDCAVIAQEGSQWDQLLKTDSVVEGIHFESDAPADWVGWKAVCRALSDIAAMGGEGLFALVTLGLNHERNVAWVKKLYSGINRAASHYNIEIVGGETVRTTGPVFITVSLTGRIEHGCAILRSSAQAGDVILVTGKLGGSIKGRHLKFHPRLSEGRWLCKSGKVHAMMDLSDGLAADLPKISRSSGWQYRLFENVLPIHRGSNLHGALNDGEDYELLLTVSSNDLPDLLRQWNINFPTLPLTVIGEMTNTPYEGDLGNLLGGFHHF